MVLHTEELLSEGKGTLREEIVRRCPDRSARVLVVGGGISAAQAALAAFHAGHEVVLRSRRPLQTRPFDIETQWLDNRSAERLRFEFLSLPVEKRRAAAAQATSGGSVPARYMEELRRLSEGASSLRLEVDSETDASKVTRDEDGEHVVVNGERFAMVILATGVVTSVATSPLYRSVAELLGAPTVDGLPHVTSFLRWVPDEDVFVLGANAVLELGPGGGNLMGAMRGARIVAHELHDLMWRRTDSRKAGASRAMFANQYATLLGGDSDGHTDGESSSEDEESTPRASALETAPARPPLSKKATAKAETARQKARKHRRATKPMRGMGR